jgi:uncharacterized membrane protein
MRKTLPFWVVIVVCMAALVASSILLVDYVRPAPVFCDTVFAYPLGIPTPLLGIAGFLAIGLAQLLPGRRARIAQAMLAAFGAIVAAGLLAVQASMKTLCPFCAVADVSALVLVALSVARALRGWDPPVRRAHLASGVAAILVAVVAPILVGLNKKAIPTSIPQVIADEMRLTPRNKVTVVDFVDFECPFCRMTHAELAPLLAERKDHVRVAQARAAPHACACDGRRACGVLRREARQGRGDDRGALHGSPG